MAISNNFLAEQEVRFFLLDLLVCYVGATVCIHSIAEMGGTAMEAEFLVEILRGVTRAAETSSRLRSILFTSFTELLQPLLVFLNRFDGNENIVCSILKLSGEMVAVHILFLKARTY